MSLMWEAAVTALRPSITSLSMPPSRLPITNGNWLAMFRVVLACPAMA